MAELLKVPLLNANEDELRVVGVHVQENVRVRPGDLLFSVESTKASSDVEAPCGGYVRHIAVREGDRVSVGALLCVITESPDEPVEALLRTGEGEPSGPVRATRRARELAEAHGLDLATLGAEGLVKERDVIAHLGAVRPAADGVQELVRSPLEGPNPIVVMGAGGHARVVVDLIREARRDLSPVAAVDDGDAPPPDVLGVPVIGGSVFLAELRERGVTRAALGVGAVVKNRVRVELFERLHGLGFEVPNLIHPRASVERSVTMGVGNQVLAGAIIGSAASLGDDVIVNSGVVISHDCRIGSHVHLTPGAVLAGGVSVGANTVIGMGVTVYLGVSIGRDVVISNGVHVLSDVPDGAIVRAYQP